MELNVSKSTTEIFDNTYYRLASEYTFNLGIYQIPDIIYSNNNIHGFPLPDEDNIHLDNFSRHYLFGFVNINQLFDWFDIDCIVKNYKKGIKIYTFNIDSKYVKFGKVQCAFDPYHRTNLKTIPENEIGRLYKQYKYGKDFIR